MAPPGLTWHLGRAVHVLWDLERVLSKPQLFFFFIIFLKRFIYLFGCTGS